MQADVFFALLIFAFVASVTPGPNNLMLLASGVNFGFVRTLPHMFGIAAGFASLLMAVGLGLGAVIQSFPAVHLGLKIAGGAYLLYLAWRIASARSVGHERSGAGPLSLGAAAAFQWVNPKAWFMSITAMALYTDPDAYLVSVLLVVLAFVLVNFPSVSVWAMFGTALRGFLADPRRTRLFNVAMGLLLVFSIVPMVR